MMNSWNKTLRENLCLYLWDENVSNLYLHCHSQIYKHPHTSDCVCCDELRTQSWWWAAVWRRCTEPGLRAGDGVLDSGVWFAWSLPLVWSSESLPHPSAWWQGWAPRPDAGCECGGGASSSASPWSFSPPWPSETVGGTRSVSPPAWTAPTLRGEKTNVSCLIHIHLEVATLAEHLYMLQYLWNKVTLVFFNLNPFSPALCVHGNDIFWKWSCIQWGLRLSVKQAAMFPLRAFVRCECHPLKSTFFAIVRLRFLF